MYLVFVRASRTAIHLCCMLVKLCLIIFRAQSHLSSIFCLISVASICFELSCFNSFASNSLLEACWAEKLEWSKWSRTIAPVFNLTLIFACLSSGLFSLAQGNNPILITLLPCRSHSEQKTSTSSSSLLYLYLWL